MKSPTAWKSLIDSLPRIGWNLALLATGSIVCAVAINGILIPKQFVSGGFLGLALTIHYLFPGPPSLGLLFLLLNLPLFALSWRFVGRRFFLYSVAGMLIFSAAVEWIRIPVPLEDKLLGALLAGIINGLGSGIILRSQGSAGGTDILSVLLLQRFSIRLGSTILAFNGVILTGAAFLFSLEGALYTLIYLYVSSHMVNLVVTGLSQRKAVFIISPRWEEISKGILEGIRRGVTVLYGQGGFTGNPERILYTVITFRELARLKRLIRSVDPDAFVVVTDTLEVMGYRIGNQPHW